MVKDRKRRIRKDGNIIYIDDLVREKISNFALDNYEVMQEYSAKNKMFDERYYKAKGRVEACVYMLSSYEMLEKI